MRGAMLSLLASASHLLVSSLKMSIKPLVINEHEHNIFVMTQHH